MGDSVARPSLGLAGVITLVLLATSSALAQPLPNLRYAVQSDRRFGYEVKIVANIQYLEETHEGVLIFDVVSASDDQFVWKCSGQLAVRTRGSSRHAWPFASPADPLESSDSGPFAVAQPQPWTLSRLGAVVVVGPVEQMPYLLGPRDLLVIESLPEQPRSRWQAGGDLEALQTSGGRLVPMGLPVPLAEISHGATRRTEYSIAQANSDSVRILKKVSLSSPPSASGTVPFRISGSGELEFDLKRGLFKSNSTRYEIQVNQKNLNFTLPVALGYRLLGDSELVDYQRRLKRQAEAARPKPIDPAERSSLLADLRSGDDGRAEAALERLARSMVDDHPDDLSAAITPLLCHPNKWIQAAAANALKVWATSAAEAALIKASRSEDWMASAPAVEALGRIRSPAAAEAAAAQLPRNRLEAGKALRSMGRVAENATLPWLSDRDLWVRAEAYSVLKQIGGRASLVELEPLAGKACDIERTILEETINAIKRRLALPGVDSKNSPARHAETEPDALRLWHDASGTYSVEASILGYSDNTVTLQRKDGRTIRVQMGRLSKQDRAWVEQYSRSNPVNPFQ